MERIDPPLVARGSEAQARRIGLPWLGVARWTLGIGLIAYLTWSTAIEWSKLLHLANALPFTALALLLLFMAVLGTSWRFCLLLSSVGLHLSLGASLRLSLIGGFFNTFLPGLNGGDLVRIYLVTQPYAGERTKVVATLLLDRLIGLAALMFLPLPLALFHSDILIGNPSLVGLLTVAAGGSLGLMVLLFGIGHWAALFTATLRMVRLVRLRALGEAFFATMQVHGQSRRAMLLASGISLAVQTLVICAFEVILRGNGASSTSWQAALLTPFGMLANALPLTPGGLGVGEAVFERLFLLVGVAGGAEAILSWRLLTTLIDLGGGVSFLLSRTEIKMTGQMSA